MHYPIARFRKSPSDLQLSIWGIIILLILLALPACSGEEKEEKETATVLMARPPTEEQPHPSSLDLITAIERVAQNTIPAVVHIEVTERQEVRHPLLPFMEEPFLSPFGGPQMPRKFERELKGVGTGMIIDNQGHILTNSHVAGGATEINVLLANGRRYPAELVGDDPKTDLAVLRIKSQTDLPQVVFGDSDATDVGEWVVAIGHPRGLDQTVTQGIISAKHRTGIMDPSSYQDFLQTDAAINPGNSGGPLLNLRGEVVGVNAAIQSISGGFEGIGFAIPSNMALHVAKQLIENGEVQRGWLGVNVQDITPELAQAFDLQEVEGALIADVVADSPAAAAGLQKGDIVVSYRGKEIRDGSTLRNEVAVTPIGEQVKLTVRSGDEQKEITVEIGSMEKARQLLTSAVEERLGVEVRPVPEEKSNQFGLEPGQGVEITQVDPDGPLGKAGFEVGDLILAVNNQPINSPETLAALLRQLPAGQRLALLVLDHQTGQAGYIRVRIR